MRFSKHCTGAAVVAEVERDPRLLSAFLRTFQAQHPGPSVLFPTSDTALLTVAQIRDRIAPSVTFLPSQAIIETMVRKTRFYRSLRQWNVPHPDTLIPQDGDLAQLAWHAAYPVFLRPTQSLRFHQAFGRKGFIAQNPHEAHRYLQLAAQQSCELMLQEIIPGPTTNGYVIRGYLDQHSQPLALMATQKIRQPSTFSNNIVKVSIPLTHIAEGVDILLPYLQGIQYHGLFGAEFKRDPRDGQLKLLEINARSMGGNYFVMQCGVNDVLAAYRDALGYPVTPITQYMYGVYGINRPIDAITLMKSAVQGRLSAHDLHPYLRPHHSSRFSWTDPLPFLKGIQTLIVDTLTRKPVRRLTFASDVGDHVAPRPRNASYRPLER
jgi:predicted ATP-grasp superfamily ATP-dependent carboligase